MWPTSQVTSAMAKSDFNRNIEIATRGAEDSAVMRVISVSNKRDSSSMKVLATLTMGFLPGTFLAVSLPNCILCIHYDLLRKALHLDSSRQPAISLADLCRSDSWSDNHACYRLGGMVLRIRGREAEETRQCSESGK
jgi:hypothetical protein